MRRSQRLIASCRRSSRLSGALAGCAGGMSSFDPSDMLDFLDTKKKLPGERKPVFPEGVPGLEQGVPKDLYKGSRQEQVDQQNAEAAAAAAAPPPRSRNRSEAAKSQGQAAGDGQPGACAGPAAAADPDAAPEEEGSTAAAPPAPKPAKIVRRRTTAPPPDAAAPAQPAPSHATICFAVPGANAERHLHALIFRFFVDRLSFDTLRVSAQDVTLLRMRAALDRHVFHHCHYRPAQCRKIDAVQPAGRAEARAGR